MSFISWVREFWREHMQFLKKGKELKTGPQAQFLRMVVLQSSKPPFFLFHQSIFRESIFFVRNVETIIDTSFSL